MCDVQILTGLGILMSGYVVAISCFISAYHWQLLVYLVWFSNLTHMACFVALREYFYSHQRERNWRFILMTILWLGLLIAVVPTAFFNWGNDSPTVALPASNARCFFNAVVASRYFDGNDVLGTLAV